MHCASMPFGGFVPVPFLLLRIQNWLSLLKMLPPGTRRLVSCQRVRFRPNCMHMNCRKRRKATFLPYCEYVIPLLSTICSSSSVKWVLVFLFYRISVLESDRDCLCNQLKAAEAECDVLRSRETGIADQICENCSVLYCEYLDNEIMHILISDVQFRIAISIYCTCVDSFRYRPTNQNCPSLWSLFASNCPRQRRCTWSTRQKRRRCWTGSGKRELREQMKMKMKRLSDELRECTATDSFGCEENAATYKVADCMGLVCVVRMSNRQARCSVSSSSNSKSKNWDCGDPKWPFRVKETTTATGLWACLALKRFFFGQLVFPSFPTTHHPHHAPSYPSTLLHLPPGWNRSHPNHHEFKCFRLSRQRCFI